MEKRTPHCKLSAVKELVGTGRVRATMSAYNGAAEVGIYDLQGMCGIVMSLTTGDYYKSMTTHADHRIWQDVYHGKPAKTCLCM
jgi:motility quorum-sensing regulator/GCU-specific mRNA interferase toxin